MERKKQETIITDSRGRTYKFHAESSSLIRLFRYELLISVCFLVVWHAGYRLWYHFHLKNSKLWSFFEFVLLLTISPVNVADKRSNTPLGHRPGESNFSECIHMLWATHYVPWLIGRSVCCGVRSAVRSRAGPARAARFEPGVGDDDGRASLRRGVTRCLAAPSWQRALK